MGWHDEQLSRGPESDHHSWYEKETTSLNSLLKLPLNTLFRTCATTRTAPLRINCFCYFFFVYKGTAYLELQCLSNGAQQANTFVLESVLYLLTPLMVPILVFGCCCLYQFIKHRSDPSVFDKNTLRDAYSAASGMAVLFLFFLQPSLVERCALVFSCVQMGDGPDYLFMTEDLNIQCWSDQHWVYVWTFGLFYLVFYVIGIPAGLFILLHKNFNMVHEIISGSYSGDNDDDELEGGIPKSKTLVNSTNAVTAKPKGKPQLKHLRKNSNFRDSLHTINVRLINEEEKNSPFNLVLDMTNPYML